MGKFDGMDPKLVRDLLGEAKRAAEELRRVEGRVGQIMTGAGLATQTTHRPAQVADAADKMVKDVTARLGVLEKRVTDRDATRPTPDDPKRNDYDPPPTGDGKPDGKTGDGKPDGKVDDGKPDGKVGDGKPDGKTGDGKPDGRVDIGTPDDKVGDGKPDGKVDDGKPDGKVEDGKPDGKVDDGKTGDGKPDGKVDDGKPDGKTGDGKPDGRVDIGTPDDKVGDGKPDGKVDDDKPDGNVCDDNVRDRGITDTPAKDHPDDRDPSRPQVVEVDGVKVIQVPIDPPTATQLDSLLKNLDKVQPIDMPQVDGRSGQVDGYPDRPSGNDQSPRIDQPIRNDPPTGSDQPVRNDPPTGSDQPVRNDPPTGSDQPIRNDPPTGSDQPVRNDPPTGTGQPNRIDPPTGTTPPSGTDQPSATQPPASDGSDGCSDNGSGRDSGTSRDAQPRDQDVRDPRQDGNVGPDGNPRQDGYGGRDDNARQDGNVRDDNARQDGVGQVPRNDGSGLVVPPTPPPDTATGTRPPDSATQPVGTQSPPTYGGTGANEVPGAPAAVSAWANDSGDVVSVNVDPLTADAIRLMIGDAQGVQNVEMPGEWREGVWVPVDIEPGGPHGSVDPETPERSA
ncbi:hypothetical protein [Nonomuraea glycinis]|uniref:hypothetical protein n=1 Tax=Nonomuraea glycinis TaxID=2047744 RepID=UPI0033A391B3